MAGKKSTTYLVIYFSHPLQCSISSISSISSYICIKGKYRMLFRTELVLAVTFLVLVVLIFVGWELFFLIIILLFLYFLGKTYFFPILLVCCILYWVSLKVLSFQFFSSSTSSTAFWTASQSPSSLHCRQYHRQRLTSVQLSICSRFICYKCERALDHTKQPVIFVQYKSFWTSTNISTFAKCSFSF